MPVQDQQQALLNIIQSSFTKEGGTDFTTFMRKLATLLKDPNNKLIQFGQSAFLLLRNPPDTVEFHTFSDEPPQKLIQAFQGLAKFLKQQGIKKAVTYAENPAYANIAKQTGLPVKMGKTAKKMQGQDKPMYTFEVTL
jgi:hypothetical protein